MSVILDHSDDPFATSVELLRPRKLLVIHGDVQMEVSIPKPVSHPDGPAMQEALARAAQRGREWRDSPRAPKPLPHVAALMEMFPEPLT